MPLVPYNSDSWIDVSGQTWLQSNIVMSALFFGQMQHETGKGTSELFLDYNNLFGMRPAQDRQKFYQGVKVYQLDNGETSEYAIYDTALLSLEDALHRMEYYNILPVEKAEDVLSFMMATYHSGYFTANPKDYIKRWIYHMRQGYPTMKLPTEEEVDERLKKSLGFNLLGIPLIALGLIALWWFKLRKR